MENVTKIIRKIKASVRYYVRTYKDMPKQVAEDLALANYRHYKGYSKIDTIVRG